MATILFAAAGAALGSTFGGTLLGISGAVIGRAVGATVGRAVDQRIIGSGSEAVEVGRIDRLRITGATPGAAVGQVWGRMRIPGQVIWSSPFTEVRSRRGGKGMPSQKVTEFSYTVSLAIALCEGEILGVERIWADGTEIRRSDISIRTYKGTETQLPDPIIEANEGVGFAPAYRGIAYLVIEALDLSVFGNRIPQLSFEVIRPTSGKVAGRTASFQDAIQAVAIIPGTGEYAYATQKINTPSRFEFLKPVNANSPSGKTDFSASIDQLQLELPSCRAASLVVSWFGSDLRCEFTNVQPKVENKEGDLASTYWRSGGVSRHEAIEIVKRNGRSVYGGTPADSAVVEAIRDMTERGIEVMFYPFVLMDQLDDNLLPDPYSEDIGQPKLPWRGRITLSTSPGRVGSPDGTAEAERQVDAFFGSAQVSDFQIVNGAVHFSGVQQWDYRRFVLHYAHLCKLAGGVESFCVGSELRGLTSIRGTGNQFPAVRHLLRLINDVRLILGPDVKLSYAADWSEYFGYHVGADVFFNLDLLWSSPNVDFVGIDYYMPLSDWRHSERNLDAEWQSQYNIDYIKRNIYGGEGYDWYYADPDSESLQIRREIRDNEWAEHWIYRPKDILSWWSCYHHERVDGDRIDTPTDWIPMSKPFRFTEFGCPAVDLGANQPNKFFDASSSESSFPRGSLGIRDDLVQMQYFRAMWEFWSDPESNPWSNRFHGRMLDQDHCYAWAWDARPFPDFPLNNQVWADSNNYDLGHWLNGRVSSVAIDSLLAEICEGSQTYFGDFSKVYGCVKGFSANSVDSGRSKIQSLSQLFSFDVFEENGQLKFVSRTVEKGVRISPCDTVLHGKNEESSVEITRRALTVVPSNLRFTFIEAESDFELGVSVASVDSGNGGGAIETEFPIVLTKTEAKMIAARWLSELMVSENTLVLSLPSSFSDLFPGKLLHFDDNAFRVNRVDYSGSLTIEAVEIEKDNYSIFRVQSDGSAWKSYHSDGPIHSLWIELPIFRPEQTVTAPFVALGSYEFRGPAVLWSSIDDSDYEINKIFDNASIFGRTETSLEFCRPGLIDRGDGLVVRIPDAPFSNISETKFLSGGNLVCIGEDSGKNWEIFQFKNVDLLPSGLWRLSNRLRGQFGTNSKVPASWPVGSYVVFLDQDISQANVPVELTGLDIHFRLGFARSGMSDLNTIYSIRSFDGIGQSPYQVCHLRVNKFFDQSHEFSWIRRSRLGGDSWDSYEIPLSEEIERYSVRILRLDDSFVRQEIVDLPFFRYDYSLRIIDGVATSYKLEVCQVSAAFGLGEPTEVIIE